MYWYILVVGNACTSQVSRGRRWVSRSLHHIFVRASWMLNLCVHHSLTFLNLCQSLWFCHGLYPFLSLSLSIYLSISPSLPPLSLTLYLWCYYFRCVSIPVCIIVSFSASSTFLSLLLCVPWCPSVSILVSLYVRILDFILARVAQSFILCASISLSLSLSLCTMVSLWVCLGLFIFLQVAQ